jgi:hypothetical protein
MVSPEKQLNKRCLGTHSGVILIRMNRRSIFEISLIVCLFASIGCVMRQSAGKKPEQFTGCTVLAGAETTPDTIRIALPGEIDPFHAPVPRNESERFLFDHLYETLFTLDCEGKVHPGLADEWYDSGGGRRWTFILRRNATFWDESSVTPKDVVDCWEHREIEPFIWAAGVDSVAVAGESSLHVYLKNASRELPRILSSSPFAIAKIGMRGHWHLGTSTCRIESQRMWYSSMRQVPIHVTCGSEMAGHVLIFIDSSTSESSDVRDLLEERIDVTITRDPAVIDYAAERPHLETIPLMWSRKYVLLSPARILEIRLGSTPPGIDGKFRDDLARDTFPGVARGHVPAGWWSDSGFSAASATAAGEDPYPATAPPSPMPNDNRRIVFDGEDPVSRSLAERIAGLGAAGTAGSPEAAKLAAAVPGLMDDSSTLSAEGRSRSEMSGSLERGDEFVYILSLPLRTTDPSMELRQLIGTANWLGGLGDDFADALLPLVDTRMYAIVRLNTAGLIIDWHGNAKIEGIQSRPEIVPAER